jgi:hypothetical protein
VTARTPRGPSCSLSGGVETQPSSAQSEYANRRQIARNATIDRAFAGRSLPAGLRCQAGRTEICGNCSGIVSAWCRSIRDRQPTTIRCSPLMTAHDSWKRGRSQCVACPSVAASSGFGLVLLVVLVLALIGRLLTARLTDLVAPDAFLPCLQVQAVTSASCTISSRNLDALCDGHLHENFDCLRLPLLSPKSGNHTLLIHTLYNCEQSKTGRRRKLAPRCWVLKELTRPSPCRPLFSSDGAV